MIKKIMSKIHLYLGLILGLPLLVIAITGAMLAFENELIGLSDSKPYEVDRMLSPVAVTDIYSAKMSDYRLTTLKFPTKNRIYYKLYYKSKNTVQPVSQTIRADPYTGEMLQPSFMEKLMEFVMHIHRRFTIDGWGNLIVANISIIFSVMVLIGLYISLPKKMNKKTLIALVKPKKYNQPVTFHFNWHKFIGIYGLLMMLMLVFTGIVFTWRVYIYGNPPAQPKLSAQEVQMFEATGQQFNLEKAVASVHKQYEGVRYQRINFGKKSADVLDFKVTEPQVMEVFVHPYTGQILGTEKHYSSVVSFLRYYNYEIHTGKIFGLLGQSFWMICSLSLVWLIYSGTWLWVKRKRKKVAKQELAYKTILKDVLKPQ